MSASTDPNDVTRPSGPRPEPKFRPVFLIFLGMPVLAALVAVLISTSPIGPDNAAPTPPVVNFTPASPVGVGIPAPDFTLNRLDGGTIRLSDYQGRWLVLNFWATWCGPCRAEMPLFQALVDGNIPAGRAVPEGVTLLAVNYNEAAEAVEAYRAELDFDIPIALDPGIQVSRQYGVYNLPVTLFIDPAGTVRYKHIGGLTPDLLDQYLAQMSGETG